MSNPLLKQVVSAGQGIAKTGGAGKLSNKIALINLQQSSVAMDL